MKCPNKSHPDWRRLVEEYGEYGATALYVKNNYNIPNSEELRNIKQEFYAQYLSQNPDSSVEGFKNWIDNNQEQQVSELFESNPELANSVYEVLAFDINSLSYAERAKKYKEFGIKKSDGTEITEQDIEQNPTFYQNNTNQSTEEYIASEKTIRDLAARMSDRIGIPVRYISDRSQKFKGKLEHGTAVVNLAYATLDTPIHEILGHPIIRAIKNSKNANLYKEYDYSKSGWFVYGIEKEPIWTASEKEADDLINSVPTKNINSQLYQNLLKELEYGKGKEVLDRVKRDYQIKSKPEIVELESMISGKNTYEILGKEFESKEDAIKYQQEQTKYYTLEEQQEEAIVELLGLYTAGKLNKVKDGKLISLFKSLLKEMKAFMKQLLGQKEVEIDKLPDNMTLGDIADLLAYSNSKLILPGNEVIYTTPDNQQFKTYQEASKHISDLAKSVEDVDLNSINIKKYAKTIDDVPTKFNVINETDVVYKENGKWFRTYPTMGFNKESLDDLSNDDIIEMYNKTFIYKQEGYLQNFIEKNKEYEQSKEIIEEWKRVNNIQYNPEEVYSRGQEFVSVVGAYSDFDVNLMMQNLLQHIEDNQKAGGEFTISAFIKPVDRKISHLEGGGGKIKFKIYPQSQDIKWAANTDVYSGSVWDASEKVNKDKKSELLGVSYTKYPSLNNVNSIQPNLAAIIDDLAHHHNELGISLTGNNFRLEYDKDIPYSIKKIIDSINSILNQKYGKLVKPDISKKILKSEKIYEVRWKNGGVITRTTNLEKAKATMQGDYFDAEGNKLKPEDVVEMVEGSPIEQTGIQPTQTKDTLKESVESVKNKFITQTVIFGEPFKINNREFRFEYFVNEDRFELNELERLVDGGQPRRKNRISVNEANNLGITIEFINSQKQELKNKKIQEKEYTSQALINTKIAKLKEVAKKYPRSLITSKVINNTNTSEYIQYQKSEKPQQIKTSPQSQQEVDKQVAKDINKAIESQLEKLGIGIGILNEFEQKRDGKTIEGEFDPSSKRKTAEGLAELIRIAQGERGQEALPEEFAHLVDLALKSNGNPLYHRLTQLITDIRHIEHILEEDEPGSFETYRELYGDDTEALAAEARAKLLKKHILKGDSIQESPWARLMGRVKTIFNNIFSKGNANELIDKINEAEKSFSSFAVALMNEEIDLTFDLNSAPKQRIMFKAKESIKKEITNADRALRKIIETEHKRLRILEATEGVEKSDTLLQDTKLLELEVTRNKKEFDKGILIFLDGIVDNIKEVFNNIPTRADREENFRNAARYLRDVKGLINAYKPLMEELIDYTLTDEYKESGLDIKDILRDITGLLVAGEREYKKSAEPMFLSFLRQFTQDLEGRTIKGKKIDRQYLQELLSEATRDISFMDRWLFSMGESSNLLLRLIEAPVKNAKFNAREQSNEFARQVQFAQEKLEKAGYKTDFMYERDENGKLTGYYIRDVDYRRYVKDREEIEKRLIKKYKRDKNQEYWREYYQELEKISTNEDGKYIPNKELYSNKTFENLAPAQKEYYNFIIEAKQTLDKLLPDNRVSSFLTPQMRKDFLERVKEAGSLKNAMKLLGSGIKDSFVARESDDEFGIKVGIQNFDNTNLEVLPIYYTNKLDNMENLSTDTGSSLIMYADMAYQYNALESIVDMMEIGKDLLKKKDISENRSNKDLVEIIQRKGRTIKNKTLKREGSSYFMDKIEDFYSAQLYGKVVKEEGSIGKLSIAKGAGFINKATALNTYAVNLLSATANVGIGKLMTRIEAISKEYFNYNDLIKADSIYGRNILSVLGQAGKSRKTNKMDLMGIKFNVMQEHESAIKGLELNRQNFFSRQVNQGALFFLNNAGEHFMQNRVFLALAIRYKLKDAQGNEINLWDAHEVVKGSDGIERVQLKKGVTKMDGSAFTSRDVEQISRRSARINQKIQGIYNTEDMNAFQRLAIGRLAMMFRKWIPPSWNRRFQGEYYNFDLGDTEQGFYNSFYFDFLKTLAQDLKSFEFNWMTRFKELTPKQQQNARRALVELGQFLAIALSYMVLSGMWDDEDEWYKHYLLYTLRRLQAESGTQIPGPTMVMEGFNLLQSPAAGLHYTQNLFRGINIINWFKPPIQSGDYKGWNKGAKHLWQAMPLVKPIERARDPKQVIQFYNNVW